MNIEIKYEYVTGEKVYVEVDEEIGTVLLDSRRKEWNLKSKENYHSAGEISTYEGILQTHNTPETDLIQKIDNEQIRKAFETLTDVQKKRILEIADGKSINDIARDEGINPNAVWKSVQGARKRFLKNFKKTGV